MKYGEQGAAGANDDVARCQLLIYTHTPDSRHGRQQCGGAVSCTARTFICLCIYVYVVQECVRMCAAAAAAINKSQDPAQILLILAQFRA